jgi:uncharacterized protein
MHLDRNGLEVLDRDDSLALLATAKIGRVLVSLDALPAAFPVNFALLDGDIVFRTGAGTKLQAAVRNTVVGFEVDDFDLFDHTGWSVLVTGHADEILEQAAVDRARRLPLRPWLPSEPAHYVRIHTQLVTGRRMSLDGRMAHVAVR